MEESAKKKAEYEAWQTAKAERDAAKAAAEQAEKERVQKLWTSVVQS